MSASVSVAPAGQAQRGQDGLMPPAQRAMLAVDALPEAVARRVLADLLTTRFNADNVPSKASGAVDAVRTL